MSCQNFDYLGNSIGLAVSSKNKIQLKFYCFTAIAFYGYITVHESVNQQQFSSLRLFIGFFYFLEIIIFCCVTKNYKASLIVTTNNQETVLT